jgi:threonine aldolase
VSDRSVADFRSDTVTRPTAGMRQAIAGAEVGDDVLGKDPTASRLELRVAELLGKEAALFFPSGTQANQAALLVHGRPGTEAVCEAESHIFHYEHADAAFLAGMQLRTVASDGGRINREAYDGAIRPLDLDHAPTSVLCVENTHNLHGGTVVPIAALRALKRLAEARGLPIHLDGARLWNAAAATGVSLDEYAACADTVMVSLSKGLGCPVGSMLAGSREAIQRAWTIRKRLGGGMRQVGILAAAGLWALAHNLERLPEDHARARRLAEGCAAIEGLRADVPDTNIVMIHVEEGAPDPESLSARLEELGVLILPSGPGRLRAVTHMDVDDDSVEQALGALRRAVA